MSVGRLLDRLVESESVSAVHALIGSPRAVALSLGRDSGGRTVDGMTETSARSAVDLFDLASLTKPWSATLALVLDAAGELPLTMSIGDVFPQARVELARRSLEDLLRHRSGLEPWQPLYRRVRSPRKVTDFLLRRAALGARRGTYSDLGFVLWGRAAEEHTGQSLEDLFASRLFEPLDVVPEVRAWSDLTRRAAAARAARVVPCRLDNRREVELAGERGVRVGLAGAPERGVVQDGNARFLGRLSAHAGLFGSALSLWRLGCAWLRPGRLFDASSVRRALGGTGGYRLGWRMRRRRGSAGPHLSPLSFGHVGFTGGSLWIDPQRQLIAVLLAHRTSVDVDLSAARRAFHRLAVGAFKP